MLKNYQADFSSRHGGKRTGHLILLIVGVWKVTAEMPLSKAQYF